MAKTGVLVWYCFRVLALPRRGPIRGAGGRCRGHRSRRHELATVDASTVDRRGARVGAIEVTQRSTLSPTHRAKRRRPGRRSGLRDARRVTRSAHADGVSAGRASGGRSGACVPKGGRRTFDACHREHSPSDTPAVGGPRPGGSRAGHAHGSPLVADSSRRDGASACQRRGGGAPGCRGAAGTAADTAWGRGSGSPPTARSAVGRGQPRQRGKRPGLFGPCSDRARRGKPPGHARDTRGLSRVPASARRRSPSWLGRGEPLRAESSRGRGRRHDHGAKRNGWVGGGSRRAQSHSWATRMGRRAAPPSEARRQGAT